jgi:diguanylate cyclase (GGDEF)-like protein
MSPEVREADVRSWWRVDLAEVLAALCRHCSDLAGVLACSIVVRGRAGDFFSAASSTEWACLLDDFQLSEEVGPTWECCTSGLGTQGNGLNQRGLTGASLAEQASSYGIVGCRSVPLSSRDETWGALTLYWGPSTREDGILTTGIAVAALATKAIEFQHGRDQSNRLGAPVPGTVPVADNSVVPPTENGATFADAREGRDARATARDARAEARDMRAAARDRRAAERDAQATAREKEARLRDLASGRLDPRTVAEQVQARRDRYAAARDRFHAKSDRAAARLDRIVSANERVESSIDGLTGAYRRDAGMLELAHEVVRARRTGDSFVLAFVDVNNLKARNDLHGHVAGDELLRKIADTLRANVRAYDLVVRYGGDEFVCGFPALDVNDAAERFARINEDLAGSDEASVAFGLAELADGDSLTDLITRADALMYANRYQRSQDGTALAHPVGRVSFSAD